MRHQDSHSAVYTILLYMFGPGRSSSTRPHAPGDARLLLPDRTGFAEWKATGDGTNPRHYTFSSDPRTVRDIVAAFEIAWDRATPHADYKAD